MPSRSKAQQRLMRGVANNPGFAAQVGIPQQVGGDYVAADQARGPAKLPERVKPKAKGAFYGNQHRHHKDF
jgi:hypothetical protein